MSRGFKFLTGMACLCGIIAAAGTALAEETQDSPLYAYTLQTALNQMQGRTTVVTMPEASAPGVSMPEPVLLQGPTSQPIGPTVCNPGKTLCPVRTTACPRYSATQCPAKTTQCPAHATQCPLTDTTCPMRHTTCPGGPTVCPIQRTQCPVRDTACPAAAATVCPVQRTQCPVRDTACPGTVATQCPRRTTKCPAQATHCPFNATTCPSRHTKCPAQATHCPVDNTRCPEHITKCPSELPTACPQKTTQCPARQTICPGGATNCPEANTACPVIATLCPAAACVPGGPECTFIHPIDDCFYNRSNPGIMVIYCQITLNAAARAIPGIEDKIRVVIDPVGPVLGGSILEWWAPDPAAPGGVSRSDWPAHWPQGGRPVGTHTLMGKARFNNDPASPAFGTYEVSAVFTGLPDRNKYFGRKNLYAQIVDVGAVIATTLNPIRVFYDRIGRTWYIPPRDQFVAVVEPNLPTYNNPGTGTNYGPNWYYYWKNPLCPIRKDPTPCACVIKGSHHDWQYEHGPTYGFYVPGEDHVNVCAWAQWKNDGHTWHTNKYTGATMCVTGTGIGPHCCGEVIAHEGLHKAIYEAWNELIILAEVDGEDDGDPYDDPDDDGIPNRFETPGSIGIVDRDCIVHNSPGAVIIYTSPDDPDTYDLDAWFGPASGYANYGDQEILCRAIELDIGQFVRGLDAGEIVVHDDWDWCKPGSNSIPPYVPGIIPWPW